MKKIIYITLLLSATLLSGCKNFLEEAPFLTQSNSLALADYDGLKSAVGGAYAPLASVSWYGADYVLAAEMRADNAMIPKVTDFQSGRLQAHYYMMYSADNTVGIWGIGYYVISAVNNVLEEIETKGVDSYVSSSVSAQDINNLKAECLFLRALAHFDMARVYGYSPAKAAAVGFNDCIPIILKTDKTAKEQPKRNTVAEVYDQIIADLLEAEKLIDPKYQRPTGIDPKAYANQATIQALLSRVYLYNQNWQGAADYATKVINNSAYKLWTASEYPKVWGGDTGGSEVIFEVYGKKDNGYDAYWEGPSHMTNPNGYADCAATSSLVNLFGDGDVRGSKGVRGADDNKAMFCTDADGKSNGQYWTMKYIGKGLGDAKNTPDFSNTVVLRLSEMYLNRAEALANGASISGASALSDINTIRSNRGADELTSVGPAAIADERRMELNFEGHTWFDLGRTTAGKVTYSDPVERKITDVPADSKYWALAIPKREYDVNSNLSHNPGF